MPQKKKEQPLPRVCIYTDGGCRPNPGPGGWAAILLSGKRKGGRWAHVRELSGGEGETTNNRMELRAAIEALSALGMRSEVELYTDSKYLQNGIMTWTKTWQRNGWRTAGKKPVKNHDMWQELLALVEEHDVEWKWTKGHAGNKWNERADRLAGWAIPGGLPLDDDEAIHIFCAATRTRWGIVLKYKEHRKELSGDLSATENQAALHAAIAGLEAIRQAHPIHVYTDCEYLHKGATSWAPRWRRRDWQTVKNKIPQHVEQWQRLAELCGKYIVHWYLVDAVAEPDLFKKAKRIAETGA